LVIAADLICDSAKGGHTAHGHARGLAAKAAPPSDVADLISGDALKQAALEFASAMRAKVEREQNGLHSIFDSWFTRVVKRLLAFDPARSWEDSVRDNVLHAPAQDQSLPWDLLRLRLFLDRWRQGRFVEFRQREQSGVHYHPRFGTEFGVDVLLTCQGAPSLLRWRGMPLMKNVFDFAMYPALLAELRPCTVFEIGSGSGASAAWFADSLALCGGEARVHSVDLVKVESDHPRVSYYGGDCAAPERLFASELLHAEPHPWLVVEDAHHNVAAVLQQFHRFLAPGDYLVVEDSDVKREAIRQFLGSHPGDYLVDTRFTDFFGRNATCAADSIFVRTKPDRTAPAIDPAQAHGKISFTHGATMLNSTAPQHQITLGDPVPWFSAATVTGGSFNLQVAAGRWIVLCFPGPADGAQARQKLAELLRDTDLFDEDRLTAHVVLTTPPEEPLDEIGNSAVSFLADYDGALSRSYGAVETARTIVLDPMLRAIANIAWDRLDDHLGGLRELLRGLPRVDDAAGVPMNAPVLIVPRVFDFAFCELLVKLYDRMGGKDSGFLFDVAGRSQTVIDHRLKRRNDLPLVAPELRETVCDQLRRRLLPAIQAYFQFAATRMDRHIVACYDSAVGGHFYRHRDNVNAGAEHRRFAVTINLNKDYDGCDLQFPEFGRKIYRAPVGGAVVFSCGALHQVTPIARGRRYAFLAFLYGEADAALRAANNARLQDGERRYSGVNDRLFPERAPA
jgi:cephalosporin hydroxylase